jgi:hypothetical protein
MFRQRWVKILLASTFAAIFISSSIILYTQKKVEIIEIGSIQTGLEIKDVPAINDARYTNVFLADNFILDSELGISFEHNGKNRFYSENILNWHHVVNEQFNDKFISVTRCPLCDANRVYISEFPLNSGLEVLNSNYILWDNFGRKWRQIDGSALGEYADLQTVSSETVRWDDWKIRNRNGEVLSINTGFSRDYSRAPFLNYDFSGQILYPVENQEKTRILLINTNTEWVAVDAPNNNEFVLDKNKGFIVANLGGLFRAFLLPNEQINDEFAITRNLIVNRNKTLQFNHNGTTTSLNTENLIKLPVKYHFKICQ